MTSLTPATFSSTPLCQIEITQEVVTFETELWIPYGSDPLHPILVTKVSKFDYIEITSSLFNNAI